MSSLVRRKKAPGIKSGLLQAQRQGAGSSSSQEAQGRHGGQPRQHGEVQASLNYLEKPGLRDKMKLTSPSQTWQEGRGVSVENMCINYRSKQNMIPCQPANERATAKNVL